MKGIILAAKRHTPYPMTKAVSKQLYQSMTNRLFTIISRYACGYS